MNYNGSQFDCTTRRLEKENQLRTLWQENERYFHKTSTLVSKNKEWSSDQSKVRSSNAVNKILNIVDKKNTIEKLEERRSKLSKLLKQEDEAYKGELKQKRISICDFDTMQQRLQVLTSLKETKRQEDVEAKLYEHWKTNDPRLREAESKRYNKIVASSWKNQVDDKRMKTQHLLESEREIQQIYENENYKCKLEEERNNDERKAKAKLLAKEQQRQLFELKQKEEETKFLKKEEQNLQESEELIHKTKLQRNSLLEQRKKQKYGMFLIQQNRQNLLRKSKQIQEDLQYDLKLLKQINKKENEEYQLKKDLQEEIRKDAVYMQTVLENQLRVEKIRESEMEKLYQKESSLQWQKRNSEWEMEKVAREKLINTVLDERDNQIQLKRETLNLIKKETLKERELLLQKIEEHQLSTQREKDKQEAQKNKIELELKEQIMAKRAQIELEKQFAIREYELKSTQKKQVEERLSREINQMTREPCFRRKRIPFT